jgi:hypothetical protein
MPHAPFPAFQPIVKQYYESSYPEFKAIMDIVAFCLGAQNQFDAHVVSIETSLDIAREAAATGNRTLAEAQRYAQAAGKQSTEALAQLSETNATIAKRIGDRFPTLIKSANDPQSDGPYLKGVITSAESTVAELERYALEMAQGIAKQESFERKLKTLPQQFANDPVIKGEVARVAGAIRQAKALTAQASQTVKKAEVETNKIKQIIAERG